MPRAVSRPAHWSSLSWIRLFSISAMASFFSAMASVFSLSASFFSLSAMASFFSFSAFFFTKMSAARRPALSSMLFTARRTLFFGVVFLRLAMASTSRCCFKGMLVNDIINYRTFSGLHSDQLSWYSGFVDLQPIKNLYLVCNDLCNYNQLTLDGYSGIVKKLPVVASFTGIIFDNEVSITDYVDCSNKTLRKLNFKIEDERGRQVPLNDVDISFSLTFFKD